MKQARMRWGVTLLVLLVLLGSSPGAHSQEKQLPVGETLEYQVYAKGLPVGEQTLRIVGERVYQNRPVLEVRMSLKSYAALAFLFSYEEYNLLYLDWATRTPVYLHRTIKEQGDHWEEEYHFGAETVEKRVIKAGREPRVRQYEAKHPLLESLSLVYYLRQRPWRQGENQFYYLTNRGPQAVTCKLQGTERIRVLSGHQRAEVIYDPVSRVTIWFSQDEAVYPLRIKIAANVGDLTARLVKIGHGPRE
ncbi:MAG TPA: DUF3108 domain-containing protein [Hydrogenispora sp.]|jgi:hypothetical protein|nr:DUF3108 domain-containing protein [Hydrogenispora sp.]